MNNSERGPLERQVHIVNGRRKLEPKKAFDLFMAYCKFSSPGAGWARSMGEFVRNSGLRKTHIFAWADEWNWRERVLEYDRIMAEASVEGDREAVKEVAKDAKARALEAHLAIADLAISKAKAALEIMDPARLTPRETALLADLGVKIHRQSYGEPTAILSQDVTSTSKVELTIADLVAKANNIMAAGGTDD